MRTKEEVDSAFELIETLSGKHGMEPDSYHKCICSLAYEYSLIDCLDTTQYLLSKCPKEYFETVQLRQMDEDENYRGVMVMLAYTLVQRNLVEGVDEVFQPTMAPANC
jgi:hypothetical protein